MDSSAPLPCGYYRTLAQIGNVSAGKLVYFHNHGEPGSGVFSPKARRGNRTEFSDKGELLDLKDAGRYLEPLPYEGFYRVLNQFYCCDKQCQLFYENQLVQLGYDDAGAPALFVPEWVNGTLKIAEEGTLIDKERIGRIAPLRVAEDGPGVEG